ncbi:MAG: NADP-dependent phosphogluconate dehydrogenase [Anderseniella sp.]
MKLAIIGLGVMGRNLAMNFRDAGNQCVVWDPWPQARDWSVEGIEVCDTLEALVNSLPVPSIVLLMVKSGKPVVELTTQLTGLLEKGDIIIDGGNSNYLDTETNVLACRKLGVHFAGLGVSGGAEGARAGPSMMLGCAGELRIALEPLLANVAARHDGSPCLGWFGEGGAGHFVKMVHNGIEYAIMQAIAESWQLLELAGLTSFAAGRQLDIWSGGALAGYLMEISGEVLRATDAESGTLLVDMVDDAAGQKGTGGWCISEALNLGIPVPSIMAAVTMRQVSSHEVLRVLPQVRPEADTVITAEAVHDALMCAVALALAQGAHLLTVASREYDWKIQLAEAARVWRQGSILRMAMLDKFADPAALFDTASEHSGGLRLSVAAASAAAVPVPVMSASLAYLDSCSADQLPTALVQLQRDRFGAHGLKHRETGEVFHGPWHEADT